MARVTTSQRQGNDPNPSVAFLRFILRRTAQRTLRAVPANPASRTRHVTARPCLPLEGHVTFDAASDWPRRLGASAGGPPLDETRRHIRSSLLMSLAIQRAQDAVAAFILEHSARLQGRRRYLPNNTNKTESGPHTYVAGLLVRQEAGLTLNHGPVFLKCGGTTVLLN